MKKFISLMIATAMSVMPVAATPTYNGIVSGSTMKGPDPSTIAFSKLVFNCSDVVHGALDLCIDTYVVVKGDNMVDLVMKADVNPNMYSANSKILMRYHINHITPPGIIRFIDITATDPDTGQKSYGAFNEQYTVYFTRLSHDGGRTWGPIKTENRGD